MSRDAVDTIRGYCYQFDKTILEIISLNKNDDFITVESIEDVDVSTENCTTAIQCKYYENTEYNHSIIAKPIRLMLTHFKDNPSFQGNYHLYGHYKSGHDKLTQPLDLEFLKKNLLTYTEKGSKYEHHNLLKATDQDLLFFLQKLTIDIHAKSLEEQKKSIIQKLSEILSCKHEESEIYFYPNAFSIINSLACNKTDRVLSKGEFLKRINKKTALFNFWIYEIKGRKQYIKFLKENLLSKTLNMSPYSRIFILEPDKDTSINDIKDCIYKIQKNWSQLSKNATKPYSPYILINHDDKNYIHKIKNELYEEEFYFCDGYPFEGSTFRPERMVENFKNKDINFQFISNTNDLYKIIELIKNRKEIYHFFITNEIQLPNGTHNTVIQVKNFSDIKDIV